MMTDDTLRDMLSSVQDSYDFFVDMTMGFVEQYGIGADIAHYISTHKEVTACDVIKETHRIVYG